MCYSVPPPFLLAQVAFVLRSPFAAVASAGQAVLTLPLQHADLTVKLPPGLQLGATPAGHLDCRMQLLGVQLDWPATTGKPQLCTALPNQYLFTVAVASIFKCCGATQQHHVHLQHLQQNALYANMSHV